LCPGLSGVFFEIGIFSTPVFGNRPEKEPYLCEVLYDTEMSKKKLPGHYCKICGERKANEKFSGKGHAAHICKECAALPQEKKNKLQILNRIENIAGKYPRSKADWELLRKYANSTKYPEVREFARSVLGWDQPEIEPDDDFIFDDADIDCMPVFLEKKKFSELDNYEKMILRDYVYSAIIEHREYSGKDLNENELIEIRKQMIIALEEECNITVKVDATLRQFFQTNATNTINKLQKKKEDSR